MCACDITFKLGLVSRVCCFKSCLCGFEGCIEVRDLTVKCGVTVLDSGIKLCLGIIKILLNRFDCRVECCVCGFNLAYELSLVIGVCLFKRRLCVCQSSIKSCDFI